MSKKFNATDHYTQNLATIEHEHLSECAIEIKNIGWTLGNDCPYRCKHCYSMSARLKGKDMSIEMIDRIVSQLAKNGVETVNLGGNEPLFTNGIKAKDTLLPYIIGKLTSEGIEVGLTTSGITLIHLEKNHNKEFLLLNDIDISLDSPIPEEHNKNRGANLFPQVLESLEICKNYNKDHSIIMCGMNWNFTKEKILMLISIAEKYGSNLRINPIKPVEPIHMLSKLTPEQYYDGFALLMEHCNPIDLGEPPIATVTKYQNAKGCPCGRTSFRIHSITPDGKIPVSPCVYLHDYKVGDLLQDELYDIIRTPQFKSFRRRNANPEYVKGCEGCELINYCKGGCAARSYLHNLHKNGQRSLFSIDPYCPKRISPKNKFPINPKLPENITLVHQDYLCTWIGRPKSLPLES